MLTKKNLWFLTLFSIILIMAVYYISLPSGDAIDVSKEVDASVTAGEVATSSVISAMRIDREESLASEVAGIKEILLDESRSTEERSDAYQALKELNANKGKEETLENTLKKDFNYDCFVKIDGSNVKVVVDADAHSYELANKIINTVQSEFDTKMYVTVSFGTT